MRQIKIQQPLEIVLGIIISPQQDILIAKRSQHQDFADYWEFPGGKVNQGEDSFAALARECKEEVNITVDTGVSVAEFCYAYGHKKLSFHCWLCRDFTGTAIGCEGQIIRWVKRNDLMNYPMPEANRCILPRLLAAIKA